MRKNKEKSASVSVIIPTMCSSVRCKLLERAIDSIFLNEGLDIQVIVVINGDKYDKDLFDRLSNDDRLLILKQNIANVSMARLFGLSHSNARYFCFLDDDDELLPNGLRFRVDYLESHLDVDVLVTNGLIHRFDSVLPYLDEEKYKNKDINIELALTEINWFSSPASIFRASSVATDLFKSDLKYFEWTYLLLLLVVNNKSVKYVHHQTYKKNEDNNDSVSKTIEYKLASPQFLLSVKTLKLPATIKKILAKKYVASLHELSEIYLREGRLKDAWLFHLKCLKNGGWVYIPYTRYLLESLL